MHSRSDGLGFRVQGSLIRFLAPGLRGWGFEGFRLARSTQARLHGSGLV